MDKKKIAFLGVVLLVILVVSLLWSNVNKEKQVQNQSKQGQLVQQQQNSEQGQQQSQEKKQEFVVDVDPDVSHWQIRETEFFTTRFPKEWLWLESNREKTGYYSTVITNNPGFDITEHADIGIFSDIGSRSPLALSNVTEVVITDRGKATSDSGTPQDSIDAIFEMAKDNNPSVDCKVTNNKTIPFTAYCVAAYDSQLQQSYYVINNKISLTLTARTTKDTLVKKEVLDKIAGSIILK